MFSVINYKIFRLQREALKYFCNLHRIVPKDTSFRNPPILTEKPKLENDFETFNFSFTSPTADMASRKVNNLWFRRKHYLPTRILKDQRFDDKTCLITGATNGIGKEMARCLAARGCDVIIPCRNNYKAHAIANESNVKDRLHIYQINLESLKSVKKCSEDILKREKKIDMVILNAGVFGIPWSLTENGIETIFQVNFLSQFSLLMNIESILSPNARVVFVTSQSHRRVLWSKQNMISPTEEMLSIPEEVYTSIKAYNISKLCSVYAMHYLGYVWINTEKSVFCAHPGTFVKTSLCQHWWVWEMLYTAMKPFAKNISQAAATPLYCATSPDLNGLSAIYYKDCERCPESDLARDFHVMFRIIDLCKEIIRNRVGEISVDTKPKLEYDRKLEEESLVY